MSLDLDSLELIIAETESGDQGTYQIIVYCQLSNYYRDEKSLTFEVEVIDASPFPGPDVLPIWIPSLVD